jgi:hypothetical protein
VIVARSACKTAPCKVGLRGARVGALSSALAGARLCWWQRRSRATGLGAPPRAQVHIALASPVGELLSPADLANTDAGSGVGGAICVTNGSTVELHNVTLASNIADVGGGGVVVRNGSRLLVAGSVFANNTALEAGGGAILVTSPGSQASVSYSNFSGNGAPLGTSLYVGSGGTGLVQQSTITEERSGQSAVAGTGRVALVGLTISALPTSMPWALSFGGRAARVRIDYTTFSLAPTQSAISAATAPPITLRNSRLLCPGKASCLGTVSAGLVGCEPSACGVVAAACEFSALSGGSTCCSCPPTWIGKPEHTDTTGRGI